MCYSAIQTDGDTRKTSKHKTTSSAVITPPNVCTGISSQEIWRHAQWQYYTRCYWKKAKRNSNTHSHSDCGCLHYYLLPFSIVDWVAVRTMEVTKGSDKNDDMQIVCIVNIVTTYATWQTQQSCCTNLIKFKSCYRWLTNVLTKMNRVFMLYLQSQLKTCAKSNMLDDLQS